MSTQQVGRGVDSEETWSAREIAESLYNAGMLVAEVPGVGPAHERRLAGAGIRPTHWGDVWTKDQERMVRLIRRALNKGEDDVQL